MVISHLFPMVQTLIVILKRGLAFLLARVVFAARVDDVACEHFLPEGKASAWAFKEEMNVLA